METKTQHLSSFLSKDWPWLFIALFFRLPGINQSLWLDEAIQALSSRLSLPQLIFLYMPGDFNPPLSHILTWISVRLTGMNEVSLRLFSLIAGIGIVWLSRRMLKVIIPEKILLINIGTLLIASAPLLIYYSQEGRPYELAAFFVTWSMVSFYEYFILGQKKQWQYVLATAVMFLTHYVAWFIYPIELLMAFLLKTSVNGKQKLFSLLLPLIGIVIVLPVLIPQLLVGTGVADALPAWRALSTFSFKQLALIPAKIITGRLPLDNSLLFTLLLGVPLLLWGIIWLNCVRIQRKESIKNIINSNKQWIFLSGWLVLPVVIGVIVSFKVAIFTYFRFLFIAPAFYLLLMYGIQKYAKKIQLAVLGLFILTNIICSGLYLFDSNFHREDWRSLAHALSNSPDKVLILSAVDAPLRYYDRGKHQLLNFSEFESVKYDPGVWLVTYAQPIFEPDNHTQRQLEGLGFKQDLEQNFRGDLIVKHYINKSGLTAYNWK